MLDQDDPTEQLNVIFDVVGTPTEEVIERLPCSAALKDRVRAACKRKPRQSRIRLIDDACDLLNGLVSFDASTRLTATSALAHRYHLVDVVVDVGQLLGAKRRWYSTAHS
mmetsp:Transcript_21931/g.47711  ORF Transcript_21931/g.47711 Transcript_21931/m.47711 type:complete len:110 (+) Transcript_21931:424-753(+)